MSVITLRDYQDRGKSKIRTALMSHAAVLFVGPTGMGKTTLFSSICAGAAEKRNRVMIVAHRYELLAQISETLSRFNVEHGLISPGITPNRHALVQVASVQALARRLQKWVYRVDLLIIDEAHHVLPSNSWGKVYEALGCPKVIGVTASPARTDGRGLGRIAGGIFDCMIDVISVAELIEDGYLVSPVVYAPATQIDLSGLRSRGGDYERDALEDRMDTPTITGDAVEHFRRLCPDRTAVAFGVSIRHCEHIAAQFREAGFNFQVIDGTMDDRQRRKLISGLGKGVQGLVSADLIGEGVDIPAIGCAILMRPTQSLVLHVQQMGRSLRTIYAPGHDLSTRDGRLAAIAASGKPNAIILDHVGNSLKWGLPQTPREWSLEGAIKKKKKTESSVAVRQCIKCYGVFPPAPICPYCGTEQPISPREVKQVDGELQEITPEMARAMAEQKKREVQKARTLEALEEIGKARGYSPDWAKMIHRSRERAAARRTEAQFEAFARR